jgi:predicted enzyme related to lactoylglutathione lyase
MFGGVRNVMIFADDPDESAEFWGGLLNLTVHRDVAADGSVYAWLVLPDGSEMGWHPAEDETNPRGASPVVYWAVEDLDKVRDVLLAAGCTHLRGPLSIGPRRRIFQRRDPFGTVVGLDGP